MKRNSFIFAENIIINIILQTLNPHEKKNERHKYENEENKYENGKHIWLKVTVIIASIVKLLNINIHKIVYTKCRKIVK